MFLLLASPHKNIWLRPEAQGRGTIVPQGHFAEGATGYRVNNLHTLIDICRGVKAKWLVYEWERYEAGCSEDLLKNMDEYARTRMVVLSGSGNRGSSAMVVLALVLVVVVVMVMVMVVACSGSGRVEDGSGGIGRW